MSDPTEYLTAQQEAIREQDENIRGNVRREAATLAEYRELVLLPVLEDLSNNKVTGRVKLYMERMGDQVADALVDFWNQCRPSACCGHEPPDPYEVDDVFRAIVEVQCDEAVRHHHHGRLSS